MSALPKIQVTVQDYLALDRRAREKYEFVGGEIVAMAGASRKHNLITFNLSRDLGQQLKGRPCEGYTGDMRVHIPNTGDYTYPDTVVVCGEPKLKPDADLDTLLNPTVIIEVMSPTTANYDQGAKFGGYRHIRSLIDYVLINQDTCHVMRYTRQSAFEWGFTETRQLSDTIELASIGCRLTLADIYDKVLS